MRYSRKKTTTEREKKNNKIAVEIPNNLREQALNERVWIHVLYMRVQYLHWIQWNFRLFWDPAIDWKYFCSGIKTSLPRQTVIIFCQFLYSLLLLWLVCYSAWIVSQSKERMHLVARGKAQQTDVIRINRIYV